MAVIVRSKQLRDLQPSCTDTKVIFNTTLHTPTLHTPTLHYTAASVARSPTCVPNVRALGTFWVIQHPAFLSSYTGQYNPCISSGPCRHFFDTATAEAKNRRAVPAAARGLTSIKSGLNLDSRLASSAG